MVWSLHVKLREESIIFDQMKMYEDYEICRDQSNVRNYKFKHIRTHVIILFS